MLTSADVLNLVQTAGVVIAVAATAHEIGARRKEQHFRNYLDGIVGFIDDAQLMLEHRELLPLYNYSAVDITAETYSQLTDDQKVRAHYCDSIIARCETVWLASEEGWVPKDEWPYWRTWVRQLARSPDFRWTVNWVSDDYAEEFIGMLKEDVASEVRQLRESTPSIHSREANEELKPTATPSSVVE